MTTDLSACRLPSSFRILICSSLWSLAAIPNGQAAAQYAACEDTLALYSPRQVHVQFEAETGAFAAGARVIWRELDTAATSCYRLVVDDALAARVSIAVHSGYVNQEDRDLRFLAADSGLVGDTTRDLVRFSIDGSHPNTAIAPMGGSINLSNRGGMFGVDVGTPVASAQQNNVGVPNHLQRVDITAMTTWSAGDNSAHRIYAAVEGVPLLRSDDGGQSWTETSRGGVDPIGFPVTGLAVSPSDRNLLFVGTSKVGLWVSRDGGETFALADSDPQLRPDPRVQSTVTLVAYLQRPGGGSRLFVALSGIGFFTSDDDGASWQKSSLQTPDDLPQLDGSYLCPDSPGTKDPIPQALAQSPSDANVVYVGLAIWGVYRSFDGGATWNAANDSLVTCSSNRLSRTNSDVERMIVFDAGSEERILVSTRFSGIWVSPDQGTTWARANGLPVDAESGDESRIAGFVADSTEPQRVLAGTPAQGLLESTDAGITWQPLVFGSSALSTPRIGALSANPFNANQVVVGTLGAGVYIPGTTIDIERAIRPGSGVHEGADLSLGLLLSFEPGEIETNDEFHLFVQSFQGYAVWRAIDFDSASGEPEWELAGLFDRINPESCSPSSCEYFSPVFIPGCFADRRANCFTFHDDGTVSFFDRDVFNGFTYQYAVTSFDYLFGGNVSPRSFDGEMLYSPRSAVESSELARPFTSLRLPGEANNHNQTAFQVNLAPASLQQGLDDVFVVPNPLRREASWDTGGSSSLRFFNVTSNSECTVYTLAGDVIATLRNVVAQGETKGIIEWDTRNQSGELVASGVYIYRITNANGDEWIDRFTIIR